jgi:hypothetical protein
MSATDGPTTVNEACEHKVADHMHGTHACYVLDRCRCADCSASNTRYENSRAVWLAGVKPHPLVDARPMRAHVRGLMAQGMGLKRIREVSGVPQGVLWKLVYGKKVKGRKRPSKKVRRATARKLLATRLELADGSKVPAVEARLIIDELRARGWTKTAIAKHVHGPHAVSLQVAQSHRSEVMAGTLAVLRELLYLPVPPRVHATGSTYQPKPKRPPRDVKFTTPGVRVPVGARSDTAPVTTPTPLPMAGVLRCKICDRPLAEHALTERCA